ncbi:MAG: NADH-quinone oxidoreductase subunit I [Verrucomicrobiales bacterium]|nr:NADH-quinone oxidoreductase subunit I [Verrucomicrobiales bacterium]|tara:strand:- start:1416 stop:1820 length:405 start_codon:yes stop_codon:yes gene_type:complete
MNAESQLQEYIPVLLLLGLAVGFVLFVSFASVLFGKLVNRNRMTPNRMKDIAYECGMLPVGEGSPRLSVKFYLVAMLFILFDIEVVFLYPWAVVYKEQLASNALVIAGSMLTFVLILLVGYFYALKKDAFEWKQ